QGLPVPTSGKSTPARNSIDLASRRALMSNNAAFSTASHCSALSSFKHEKFIGDCFLAEECSLDAWCPQAPMGMIASDTPEWRRSAGCEVGLGCATNGRY